MDPAVRAGYEGNTREMFDAMRAYHQSETSHTNHALTLLLAIGGAAGAVIMALVFPDKPSPHAMTVTWGLVVAVSLLAALVAYATNRKIASDHGTYAKFGAQYVATSQILGYYDEVKTDNGTITIKTDRTLGQGKGTGRRSTSSAGSQRS